MCERLPGNRCAHHIKADVERKKLKAASIIVDAGVQSPSELPKSQQEKYAVAIKELREAEQEVQHTVEVINRKKLDVRRAHREGDEDTAQRLESEIYEAQAMRQRRKDGLRELTRTEQYISQRIARDYTTNQQGQEQAEEIVYKAIQNKRSQAARDDATLIAVSQGKATARREKTRLDRERSRLDKEFSEAVDADDTTKKDEVLSKIEGNLLKQAVVDARTDRLTRIERDTQHRLNPPVHSSYSYGCGGGRGC